MPGNKSRLVIQVSVGVALLLIGIAQIKLIPPTM